MNHPPDSSEVLFASLREFFEDPAHLARLTDLLNVHDKKSKVSLRLLDWFAVKSTKMNAVVIGGTDVHSCYKAQLRGYSKILFDAFKRGPRKTMKDASGTEFETTTGQLNFIRWAARSGVLEYCETHGVDLEARMKSSTIVKNPARRRVVRRTVRETA